MEECKEYIKDRTSLLNYLEKSINPAKQFHNTCVKEIMEKISGRAEQNEHEELMLDLNRHLEVESNILEAAVIQWLNKIVQKKRVTATKCADGFVSRKQQPYCK
ncbi:hypothetical protein V3C99_004963 [Haemonchus contortus]